MSEWLKIGLVEDIPANAGICYKYQGDQIAIYNFDHQEWFATQNLCPHKQQMVLSRGLIGDTKGELKVSCPLHKHSFSLSTGKCLAEDKDWCLKTYAVKVENAHVYLEV